MLLIIVAVITALIIGAFILWIITKDEEKDCNCKCKDRGDGRGDNQDIIFDLKEHFKKAPAFGNSNEGQKWKIVYGSNIKGIKGATLEVGKDGWIQDDIVDEKGIPIVGKRGTNTITWTLPPTAKGREYTITEYIEMHAGAGYDITLVQEDSGNGGGSSSILATGHML